MKRMWWQLTKHGSKVCFMHGQLALEGTQGSRVYHEGQKAETETHNYVLDGKTIYGEVHVVQCEQQIGVSIVTCPLRPHE